MYWKHLFSTQRSLEQPISLEKSDRSDFERDFDRIVFSYAFRRLQDKTQVIPMPESDFVHSRLTHSLETSCVGRSLGKIVGNRILNRHPELKALLSPTDFSAVVAAASLAHDIGNPPFGHSGEASISNYFRHGKGKAFQEQITEAACWSDLINFEGNANGFRLLTSYKASTGGGISLCYSTLAAFTKYPTQSLKTGKNQERISQKKYGYFQSEKVFFENIFQTLQIPKLSEGAYCRHPLAFLVEAADDICYRIIDFEDGIRIGLIPFKEGEEILISLLEKFQDFDLKRYNNILDAKEKIAYLRAKTINKLVYLAADVFTDREQEILDCRFDRPLMEEFTDYKATLDQISQMSLELLYESKQVLQIETAGFNVVGELLDLFIEAVNDFHEHGDDLRKVRPQSAKVIKLLPLEFLGSDGKPEKDLYLRILQICEFVAGMTDTYAVNFYRKLKGIELPK
jgi:dGTPase